MSVMSGCYMFSPSPCDWCVSWINVTILTDLSPIVSLFICLTNLALTMSVCYWPPQQEVYSHVSHLGDRLGQGGGEGEAESATPPSPSPLWGCGAPGPPTCWASWAWRSRRLWRRIVWSFSRTIRRKVCTWVLALAYTSCTGDVRSRTCERTWVKQTIQHFVSPWWVNVGVGSDPDMVQLLVGLHQLFLQFDDLQHCFVLHIQQAFRHLWAERDRQVQVSTMLWSDNRTRQVSTAVWLTVLRFSSNSSTRSRAAVLVSASSSSVPTSNTLSRYAWIWTCSLSLSVCFSLCSDTFT